MSPLKITFLLNMHCLARPIADMPHEQAFAPAMHKALTDFKNAGLVAPSATLTEMRYRTAPYSPFLTDKGEALVAHIKAAADIAEVAP